MKGEWTKTMPETAGRYYFRNKEWYGICLIAWTEPFAFGEKVDESKLKPVAFTLFGRMDPDWQPHCGETGKSPGWSHGTREDHQGMEFWSEPLFQPPGFLDIPNVKKELSQEVIDREREDHQDRRKKQNKEDKRRAKEEREAVEKAVNEEQTLYRCESCASLLWNNQIVIFKKRHCPHCCIDFIEQDGERNCPDCNRPFTRLEEEFDGCPNCEEDSDLQMLVEKGVLSRAPETY